MTSETGLKDEVFCHVLVRGGGGEVADAIHQTAALKTVVSDEQPASSSERQRQRKVPLRKGACSSSRNAVQKHDTSVVTPVRDARGALNGELTGDQYHAKFSYQQDIGMENVQERCTNCGNGGQLLHCAGQGCSRSFHLSCVKPPFESFPSGVWHCIWCVKKKMELGVYSVSEGIESILDAKRMSDDEGSHMLYLVKYKGLAHAHNCWIARERLVQQAPAVWSLYNNPIRLWRWEEKWTKPQCLLEKRLLILPEHSSSNVQENNSCHYEWLVKWTGLGYDQATWELENASFLRTPEGMKLISDFASRHAAKEEANQADQNKMCCFLGRGGKRYSEEVKLAEFWVPVLLSDLQNEQYCASVFTNSLFLSSSSSRSDPAVSLLSLLKTTRKCCDHPKLVDESLRDLLLEGKPESAHFDLEMEMSGKLQLLNKILPEIKRRGLRVLILFQVVDRSGKVSVGDILDDFIKDKFGRNSYSRISGQIARAKKQATLDVFNNEENGNFVCLMETRDCLPSIRLSSVDTVIIFNSDWDPVNDLKALKRMTIETQLKQLKIFRLYSCYTAEEKILILAKEGVKVGRNTMGVNKSSCQKLLTWGCSSLFSRLGGSSESSLSSLEQTLNEDVIEELSALLPCNGVKEGSNCSSTRNNKSNNILSVQLIEGTYQGNAGHLIGESKVQLENNLSVDRELKDKPPKFFWRKLLEGRKPRWKYVHSQLNTSKRKAESICCLSEEDEGQARAAKETERGLGGDNERKRRRGVRRNKQGLEVADNVPLEHAEEAAAAPSRRDSGELQKEATLVNVGTSTDTATLQPGISTVERSSSADVIVPSALMVLLREQKEEVQKAIEQEAKTHEELKLHLQSECEKEIAEVRRKYDVMLHNAEAKMSEKKSELECQYQMINKQSLVAEAVTLKQHFLAAETPEQQEAIISTLMKEINELRSRLPTATRTISGPPPPPPTAVSLSTVPEYSTCDPAIPQGESVEAHVATGSTSSANDVNIASAGQQMAIPAVPRPEYSSSGIPNPTPPSQASGLLTTAQSSLVLQPGTGASEEGDLSLASSGTTGRPSGLTSNTNTQWRPPSIRSILESRNLPHKPETRAPAPHLRNKQPRPAQQF